MSKRSLITLKNLSRKPDWFLLTLVLGLTVFGVIMVGNASVVEAYRDFEDKFYYFRLQLRWLGFGLLVFVIMVNFFYARLRKISFVLLIFAFISLIVVLIPGVGTQALGARRWLNLAGFSFQPAELTKFAFLLWAAGFLTSKGKKGWFFAVLLALVALIMLEPDLGTTVVIIASALAVYFVAGVPFWQIGLAVLLAGGLGVGLVFSSAYRKERLLTFFNPGRDPLGASYHIRQVLIALGSGGIFGLGLGQSRQKYEYLPEVTTDSIFAVIAEETGFIGGAIIIFAFLLLIWRGLKIAKEAPDDFGRLLATGLTAWLGFQALINLAAMVALVPLTGIPLPFISYGGSSLVLSLMAVGILLNISRYRVVRK